MVNRGNVKSGCKGWLLHNSGRNSGVLAWGTDSRPTGSVLTFQLNSGPTGHMGHTDDLSGARPHGRRISCMSFFC